LSVVTNISVILLSARLGYLTRKNADLSDQVQHDPEAGLCTELLLAN
jgi:hypothetical protein